LHAAPGEPPAPCELSIGGGNEALETRAVLIRERGGRRRRGIGIQTSVGSVDVIGAGRPGPAGPDLGWLGSWAVLHAHDPNSINRDAFWLAPAARRASVGGGLLLAPGGETAENVDLGGWHGRHGLYTVFALGDPARRFVALDLLDRLDVTPAKRSLLPELGNADPLVRLGVAEALGSSKVTEAADVIAAWLSPERADVSPFTRRQIALALGRLGAESAVPALAAALDDPAPEVRRAAVAALGEIGGPTTWAPVASRARDPDRSVRETTATWLGEIGGTPAVEALGVLIGDPDPRARLAAVKSASKLPLRALLPSFIERLHDPDGEVQYAAVGAVDKLRAREAAPHLVPLLTVRPARQSRPHALCWSPSIWLSLDCAAAQALAHIGDPAGLAEAKKRVPHCLASPAF
jgi:HEAT repeat protein